MNGGIQKQRKHANGYPACKNPSVSEITSNRQFILNVQEDTKILRTYAQK